MLLDLMFGNKFIWFSDDLYIHTLQSIKHQYSIEIKEHKICVINFLIDWQMFHSFKFIRYQNYLVVKRRKKIIVVLNFYYWNQIMSLNLMTLREKKNVVLPSVHFVVYVTFVCIVYNSFFTSFWCSIFIPTTSLFNTLSSDS